MPESPKKTEAFKKLEEAEKALKIAEDQATKNIGYQLCKSTWPPQIMLTKGYKEYQENFECPRCRVLDRVQNLHLQNRV